MAKREPFLHCWWDCKLIQPLWKAVWRFLIKLKTELSHVLAIQECLGVYAEKTAIQKDTCAPVFMQHWGMEGHGSNINVLYRGMNKDVWYTNTLEY